MRRGAAKGMIFTVARIWRDVTLVKGASVASVIASPMPFSASTRAPSTSARPCAVA